VSAPDELGAHLSIAGGLWRALERGRALGCGAVQLFLKNQRQWRARPLEPHEVAAFHQARRRTGIRWVFAHASYLINLAAPDAAGWARAVDAFTDELERAEALGLDWVVIHPGSHGGRGAEWGLTRVVSALNEVMRRTAGFRTRVALENTAGAGSTLGRTFAELGRMLAGATAPERLGVCLDTCHLFAAGYDLRHRRGWQGALAECGAAVGLERVLAFHLNDARAPLGSGLDRHEHIGRGFLGLAPFRRLLRDQRFRDVPKVIETPKGRGLGADRRNLTTLRALRLSGSGSRLGVGRTRGPGTASSGATRAGRRSARSSPGGR
jgi:deoxyribonuclease-4